MLFHRVRWLRGRQHQSCAAPHCRSSYCHAAAGPDIGFCQLMDLLRWLFW